MCREVVRGLDGGQVECWGSRHGVDRRVELELELGDIVAELEGLFAGRVRHEVGAAERKTVPAAAESEQARTDTAAELGRGRHVVQVLLEGAQEDEEGGLEDVEVVGE
jgi:hypothetical protein